MSSYHKSPSPSPPLPFSNTDHIFTLCFWSLVIYAGLSATVTITVMLLQCTCRCCGCPCFDGTRIPQHVNFYTFLMLLGLTNIEVLKLFPWANRLHAWDGYPNCFMATVTMLVVLAEDVPQMIGQVWYIRGGHMSAISLTSLLVTILSIFFRIFKRLLFCTSAGDGELEEAANVQPAARPTVIFSKWGRAGQGAAVAGAILLGISSFYEYTGSYGRAFLGGVALILGAQLLLACLCVTCNAAKDERQGWVALGSFPSS